MKDNNCKRPNMETCCLSYLRIEQIKEKNFFLFLPVADTIIERGLVNCMFPCIRKMYAALIFFKWD